MPSISGAALADAFQPGTANILVYSMGTGLELKGLLLRLAPYQAAFVVEPCTWSASLALRLNDFSRELCDGRIVLFLGDNPWDEMRDFFAKHPGYLEPQRILSWPWFDADTISEISSKLGQINSEIHEIRNSSVTKTCEDSENTAGLAIVSNVVDDQVFRVSEMIELAAKEIAMRVIRLTLDQPAMAHPAIMARTVCQFSPSVIFLPGCTPAGLGFALPNASIFSFMLDGQAPNRGLIEQLGNTSRIVVTNEVAKKAWNDAGIVEHRLIVIPPAARTGMPRCAEGGIQRIAVFADGGDTSAKSVGLHLASHIKLYEEAARCIRKSVDSYCDEHAADVLIAAEQRIKVRIESQEVRAGLIERIGRQLGPVVVRGEVLRTIASEGIEFDLFGADWQHDAEMGKYLRGRRPRMEEAPQIFACYGASIIVETGHRVVQEVLDGLAAGHVVFVRGTPASLQAYSQYAEIGRHIRPYMSPHELLVQLRTWMSERDISASIRDEISNAMQTMHTWSHRLHELTQRAITT